MNAKLVASAVVLVLLPPPVPFAAPTSQETPARLGVQQDSALPAVAAPSPEPVRRVTGRPYRAQAPVWPAGSATVALTETPRRAGTLPVTVRARDSASASAIATQAVTVDVLDRAATAAVGVRGLVMRLSSTAHCVRQRSLRSSLAGARCDAHSLSGPAGAVHLEVDYSGFRDGFSGGASASLGLVRLTGCVPVTASCTVTPVASTNNVAAGVLSADVAGNVTLAVAEQPSGAAGDYSATPLQPSSTWQAGGSSGDFTWQYPLRVPPGLSGPEPELGVGYSAQSVDGEMAASNNQPSWLGEGFGLATSAIERRYVACGTDMGGTANNTTKTGDRCWKTDNATMTLNGESTELLKGSDGYWHGRTEDGSRIELRTGATNGDQSGQWWVVTNTDGTQYWFGRNQLPGWSSGKAVTNSVWTVPVFGNNPGEPCYHTAFADSACDRAWRWNLDYVVDPFGNTMSYWYGLERNQYAKAGSANTLASYVRGGWLDRIDYGTRSDTAYGTAPTQVDLGEANRCLTSSCATHDAANWPDTPWTLECTKTPCTIGSPTFWITKRLGTLTTKVGGKPVDQWTFTHTFPDPGDTTRAGLWLDSIGHKGLAGTTDGTRTAVSMPDVHFVGVQKPNRVDAIDTAPAMNWWRIAFIETETGGSINVTYSDADCVRGSRMPDPAALYDNTLRCFPVYWNLNTSDSLKLDFFHKYVVTTVTETDLGLPSDERSVPTVTRYAYLTAPAWRYTDDDGLVDDKAKTWSVWRGYGRVRTTVGEGAEAVRTEAVYFRGMDGDKLGSGNRSVTLPAAGGAPAIADSDTFAGTPREQLSYQDATGTEIGATVTVPWRSNPTATRTIDGVTAEARYVGVAETRTRIALDGGRGWRTTTARQTYDSSGMVIRAEDLGDDAVTDDQRCTLTDYARNTTAWITETVSREREFAVDCTRAQGTGLTEADVISDTYTLYDGGARGAAPTKGAVTQTDELVGYPSRYIAVSKATYDAYGRAATATDIRGNKTTTTYTPATGGPVSSRLETTQLGWKTTTTVDPAWGLPISTVDPNGKSTRGTYDALGRRTAVWLPNRPSTLSATATYRYLVRKTGGSVTVTSTLNGRGDGYLNRAEFFDGQGRPRQTQATEGTTAGGRIVSDTFYDSAGRAAKQNTAYIVDGAVDVANPTFLKHPDDAQVPSQTVTTYDGAGRVARTTFRVNGVEKWHTTAGYGGDRVDVTPPAGSMPTSTYIDARDRPVRLRQFHTTLGTGDYTDLTYTYDRKSRLTAEHDNVGNAWTYAYDFLGRQTSRLDPDAGRVTKTYNDAGDVLTGTDAEGRVLAYAYDSIGRKTTLRRDSATGPLLAAWTYDTIVTATTTVSVLGQVVTSTSYVGTAAYTVRTDGYTDMYQPTGETIIIPSTETGLAGSYSYTFGYTAGGADLSTTMPAVGGLPREKFTTGYNALGRADTLKTNVSTTGDDVFVVNGTGYTRYGELGLIARRSGDGPWLDTAYDYETGTRRLSRILTTRETNPSLVADVRFDYDPTGNVVSERDVAAGDTQCFGYDYARRLTDAWTPASGDCAATRSQSLLGGPAPYWNSYAFDAVGNRTASTERTPTTSVTRSYTYPAAQATQPHALQSMTTTGAGTATYTYDKSGNTLTRPANGTSGAAQSLTWNPDGTLATSTDASGTTTYVYDAAGNRLIKREPSGTTLSLPGQDVRVVGGQATATRYITHAGHLVAVRTSAGLMWQVDDQQGTATVQVDAASQAVTKRWATPFGADRGAAVSWVTDKGLVGGTKDGSGLTHLGAREYDPTIGRFVSVDPVFDGKDPQQMQGYNYGNASPVTFSDPEGTFAFSDIGKLVARVARKIAKIVTRKSSPFSRMGQIAARAARKVAQVIRHRQKHPTVGDLIITRLTKFADKLGYDGDYGQMLQDVCEKKLSKGFCISARQMYEKTIRELLGKPFDCKLFRNPDKCEKNVMEFWNHIEVAAGYCSLICFNVEFQGGKLQAVTGPGGGGWGFALTYQSSDVDDQAPVSIERCTSIPFVGGFCGGFQPTQRENGDWNVIPGVSVGVAYGEGDIVPFIGYNFASYDVRTNEWESAPSPFPGQVTRYAGRHCGEPFWLWC